ncbi:peptidase [Bacillus sp. FJAT-45066]|uniref:peptidase n=1 Tax=Bacillus sp. FJAT-45066 TaxID=2011010 RepID=UPI000BB7F5A4|nr:peptidase [Bacillus sp. FJAT-45066]
MKDVKKEVENWLLDNEPRMIKLLQRLVQEPSTQGVESAAQAIIVETCRELGLQLDIWEPGGEQLKKHPYFVTTRKNFSNSPNVVAVRKGTGGGKSIILNGHIDVVPEGDVSQWNDEPFSGSVVDGKLYGRGSTDMKGGNVALLMALKAIQSLNIPIKGDIIFQSVIEEESGGAGTLAAILRGYKADAALIPEPTNMKIFPKQQGSLWFRLVVKGKSAHGGTRYEGVSAIEKAMLVVQGLLDLEKLRNARVTDPLYKNTPIPLPINIGKINGGSWPSSVPDSVELEGRIGVGPEEDIEKVKEELEQVISQLYKKDSWFVKAPIKVEWFGARWVPGSVEIDHPFVQTLIHNFEIVKQTQPTIEASPWGTDGGLFTQLLNIPIVVFGPGATEVAHFPNEYISIQNIMETTKIITFTLLDWCEIDNT